MKSFAVAGLLSTGLLTFGVSQVSAAPQPAGKPAEIHVTVPADATLTIDGQPTKSTSADRWFVTPPLAPGKTLHYDVTATFLRDGKKVSVEQSVPVMAGEQTNVSFDLFGSRLSAGRGYAYGTGMSQTQAFYYQPESYDQAAYPPWAFPTPGLRGYYVPPDRPIVGYRLSGIPVPAGGFHPLHWGRDPSDPFYPHGRW
jgi:uncharacterized protein (TIGR03000 family)